MGVDSASAHTAAEIGRALLLAAGAPRAAVFFRSMNGTVTCPWSHNLTARYVKELVTPEGVNPWVHMMRYPELECMDMPKSRGSRVPAPHHIRDVRQLPVKAAVRQRLTSEGTVAVSLWPLVRDRRVVGAIACYYDAPHVCTDEEQAAMLDFTGQAAAAVPLPTQVHAPNAAPLKSSNGAGAHDGAGAATTSTGEARDRTAWNDSDERLIALERDLAARLARLVLQRASLEAESHRMAAEAARIAAERQALDAERARLERPRTMAG